MQSNLAKQTLFKTTPLTSNSIGVILDKKLKVAISHTKGIHILDSPTFQQSLNIKLDQNLKGNISCICVSDELIFFACGMTVGAAALNGKIIMTFQTFLATQRIDKLHIEGYRLWVISGSLVNQFLLSGSQLSNKKSRMGMSSVQKNQDVNSHMFDSKINASFLSSAGVNKFYLILLMQSNQIITFDKKQALATIKTQSPPTCGILFQSSQQTYLIGLMSGQLTLIKPSRTHIKILWTIRQNSKGKINCISLSKNGFIVCRDTCIQFWNTQRELIASELTTEKIMSCIYIEQFQTIIYGTANGNISIMTDLQKMLANKALSNQFKVKQDLRRQIQRLQQMKNQLQVKLAHKGVKKIIKISIKHNLSISYSQFCYLLEFSSENPIFKVVLKGNFYIIDQKNLTFKAYDSNKMYNCIFFYEGVKNLSILLNKTDGQNTNHQSNKVNALIFVSNNETKSGLSAVSLDIELKILSLYQKIKGNSSDFEGNQLQSLDNGYNKLNISGHFKYHEMHLWLNGVFNDFGANQGDAQNFSEGFYESILTKSIVLVRYKTNICQIYSSSTNELYYIKNYMILKSKDKNLNFSYQTKIQPTVLQKFFKTLIPQLEKLTLLKQKKQLLPGLLQLRDQVISHQLAQISRKSQEIKLQYQQNSRKYDSLKTYILQMMSSYKSLSNKPYNEMDRQILTQRLQKGQINWDSLFKSII